MATRTRPEATKASRIAVAMARVTSFSRRAPNGEMAPGSWPPWPASSTTSGRPATPTMRGRPGAGSLRSASAIGTPSSRRADGPGANAVASAIRNASRTSMVPPLSGAADGLASGLPFRPASGAESDQLGRGAAAAAGGIDPSDEVGGDSVVAKPDDLVRGEAGIAEGLELAQIVRRDSVVAQPHHLVRGQIADAEAGELGNVIGGHAMVAHLDQGGEIADPIAAPAH